jgi:glycogen debranching enzyme
MTPGGFHAGRPIPGSEAEADQFYIRTPASRADDHNLVLEQDDTFVVLDPRGDVRPVGLAEEGLYHAGTRYLSRLTLWLAGAPPLLLSSAVTPDNARIVIDLTNLDVASDGNVVPRGTLHLRRTIVLWHGVRHDRLHLRNYGVAPVTTTLSLAFDADYADIFEVRGTPRARRGRRLETRVSGSDVVLGYVGLDRVVRRTRFTVSSPRRTLAATRLEVDVDLPPGGEEVCDLSIACEYDRPRRASIGFADADREASAALETRHRQYARVRTSNQHFNEWINRSVADLTMLTAERPEGDVPYAGVPWFSAPFGRDSLITALECLWIAPSLARGVLDYLAATQATTVDPERDAQPGKILHEARHGEMAALGEIPFGRYYGSQDATPLFLMLAAAYYERTGDRTTIERIWPQIRAALAWIDRDGDSDGDGFIEYERQSSTGLVHQGWKDSHDAIFHRDGRPAEGPIATCEIQGYVFAAWRSIARLAMVMGDQPLATSLRSKADALRARFDEAFWCEAIGTYALALDGAKDPCVVISSNAGHALFTGIASPERGRAAGRTLVGPSSFSGWGVRTVAAGECRYNPMSYHNGSVWPHDNAILARGLARYGLREEAVGVLNGLFQASARVDLHRLPELFCGFPRRGTERPTLYPVACNPQAWAAGSVFLLLQAAIGIELDAVSRTIRFEHPRLPASIDEVQIEGLRLGPARVDLRLERHGHDVGLTVLRREGDVQIVARK